MADTATYRTIWRWHFYAGLFVLPFVLLLLLIIEQAAGKLGIGDLNPDNADHEF